MQILDEKFDCQSKVQTDTTKQTSYKFVRQKKMLIFNTLFKYSK